MKRKIQTRLASAALSAAVLLPFNPVFAQEANPPATAPAPDIVLTTPPLAEEPESPAVSLPEPNPVLTQPVVAPPAETAREPEAAERRTVQRSRPAPARARAPTAPTVRGAAPAAAPVAAETPAPAGIEVPPATAIETAPVPAPLPVDTPAAVPSEPANGGAIWPWLIGALALAGLLAFALVRRRRNRRVEDDYRTGAYDGSYAAAPLAADEGTPVYDENYVPADPFGEAPAAHEPDPTFAAAPVAAADPPVGAEDLVYGEDYVPADPFGEAPAAHDSLALADTEHRVQSERVAAAEEENREAYPRETGASESSGTAAAALGAGVLAGASDRSRDERQEPPIGEVETSSVTEPDPEALGALTQGSEPVAERPWLELMMRPVRAGTTEDEARVEFELTVGNNGQVPAEDVRISSWMFAAGSAQESAMERMLIDPPANAALGQLTIPPGHGARIAASIAIPRSGFGAPVLPVVVADARYPLPDGGQGRISASFAVGRAAGDGIEPFSLDSPAGLEEELASRLYGEVQSV